MKSVQIILESGPPNWSGYVPSLPGCIATGRTMEQTIIRLKEAIRMHLESMVADGDEIPEDFRSDYSLDVQVSAE